MGMYYRSQFGMSLCLACVMASCSSSRLGIPETLEPQIDKNVTFAEVLASPDSYKGRLIIVGAQLLKAKRLKDGLSEPRRQKSSFTSPTAPLAPISI